MPKSHVSEEKSSFVNEAIQMHLIPNVAPLRSYAIGGTYVSCNAIANFPLR